MSIHTISIGNITLDITLGQMAADKLAAVELDGLKYTTYHKVASKVFAKDKHGKGFDRKDAYSPALGQLALTTVLEAIKANYPASSASVRAKDAPKPKVFVLSAEDAVIAIDPQHPEFQRVVDLIRANQAPKPAGEEIAQPSAEANTQPAETPAADAPLG